MRDQSIVDSLNKNPIYRFIMDNIREIMHRELEPRRKEIENDEIELEPLVENIRQQVLLYLNDLLMKNVIHDIPDIVFFHNKVKEVYFDMNVESFYKACSNPTIRPVFHATIGIRH